MCGSVTSRLRLVTVGACANGWAAPARPWAVPLAGRPTKPPARVERTFASFLNASGFRPADAVSR